MSGNREHDRYALSARVIALVESDLAAEGFELLDVRIFSGGGRRQVRLYLDTAEGITLDGCTGASRTVGMLLEESDLFADRYVIEVSSPGIRRPLRTQGHFTAAVGQNVEMKFADGDKVRRLRGTLTACDEHGVSVRRLQPRDLESTAEDSGEDMAEDAAEAVAGQEDGDSQSGEVLNLAYARILEANLDPEFDVKALIGADRRKRKEAKKRKRAQQRRGGKRKTGKVLPEE